MANAKQATNAGRYSRGRLLCAATNKTTGQPCKAFAVTGSHVCFHHGGASLKGIEAPLTKTGRYSKHVPTRILGNFMSAIADVNLIGLKDDIALLESRELDLLSQTQRGESEALWRRMRAQHEIIFSYMFGPDAASEDAGRKIFEAVQEMQQLTSAGISDWETWNEISEVMAIKQRMIEAERRHELQQQEVITVQQVALTFGKFIDVIQRNVTNSRELAKVMQEIFGIIDHIP